MGDHYVEFSLFQDHESAPLSFPYCGCNLVISSEIVKLFDVYPNDPHGFNYVSTKVHGLDCAKVDLVNNFSSSIVKDKPYSFHEGYLSDYCRFLQGC